ncbi:hypothetical protein FRC11_004667 [Ceratobasidium sp. 423]|nr:hypothetical protein FRC11_004667 [Ceratobasidium sp. 423]
MAVANHPVAQPAPRRTIANAIPPVVPGNAPIGEQLPANVPHGVQAHHPQNIAAHNHPVAQIAFEPVGAIVPGVLRAPGVSPLLRSLYGRRFGN